MKNELQYKRCDFCSVKYKAIRVNQSYCNTNCRKKHARERYFASGKHVKSEKKYGYKLSSNVDSKKPLAGDIVYVANSNDKNISVDTLGLIEGKIGVKGNKYTICFDPELPALAHLDNTVSSSKGHRKLINIENLHYAGNILMQFERVGVRAQDHFFLVKKFLVIV